MDRPFDDCKSPSPFDKVDMSFRDGLLDAFRNVKDSYKREATVSGCPIALNMVLNLRGEDLKVMDAYADA